MATMFRKLLKELGQRNEISKQTFLMHEIITVQELLDQCVGSMRFPILLLGTCPSAPVLTFVSPNMSKHTATPQLTNF